MNANASTSEKEQEQIKHNVLSRMKRIEGQVRGIQRMIEDGKECEDILVQVRAVRSALQSANKLILKRYMLRCYNEAVLESHDGHDEHEALEKFIKVLTGFLEG
ncbi:MAG: metal-sensitive transcriptional regulator [Pseudodesulfovibrio sp.]|uniref:Metal sensitive transcriptional repressor n=1 Tax=Pseudodesulfovibrio aespoeensis (strain ATCC 700646 / DSM 10631 / Aspo-2) TaxID=643562 RepID=E6VR94_PSEA9|nr:MULTISPECIES: metal-sensitive transcriptional regulator [Pseudodesulfovibrio]MBU4190776.1 metal-sensitive transcriptional regulator [Pseudomonadota bacterium]ADU64178.1 protein of unknown function DUF156 [Pseudodesulfovibrio aespoeensis Aspo-2]MBU4245155.1 metal-sensitive transcriptional regulator [Pseudomonadota bacterium]MBU4378668.1 metal-sensitive transcriptional regulator [Pseudomonadota bacterium]MBU4474263.1 metal-sensitive transcriptional regulator [Pseudomonadota bacterium]